MSVYKTSIKAFIEVLEAQPNLISQTDWQDLTQLVSNLPTDEEDINTELETWLQSPSRSPILEAYKQKLTKQNLADTDIDSNIGIGRSKSSTKANESSPSSQELLINSIKKNSPLSKPPTPQPDQPSNP